MLSLGKISRDHLGYNLDLSREDYQEAGGERPGYWLGRGAEALGLTGGVDREALYNLFDGLTPDGRAAMVQIQARAGRPSHQSGWDLTYSAPKSVSILWSQGDAEARSAVEECHREAVAAAFDYLEEEVSLTRTGKGGLTLERSRVVAAAFEHGTSRAGDPNLHSHVLLANVGIRPDGTSGTLHSPNLYHAKMTAGALYRTELAAGLQRRGVEIEADGFSFRVRDVPKDLEREQSKRRRAIAVDLREGGGPREAAAAALRTRERKQEPSWSILDERWRAEAARFGWGREEADRCLRASADRRPREEQTFRQAMDGGLHDVRAKGRDFNRQDFLRQAAQRSVVLGYSAAEVRRAATNYLRDAEAITPERDGPRGVRYRVRDEGEATVREVGRGYDVGRDRGTPTVTVAQRIGDHRLRSVRSTSLKVGEKAYSGLLKAYVPIEVGVTVARAGAMGYDRLLEAFVRFTREEGLGRGSVIVAGSTEDAERLNLVAQEQRRKDRELDEAFIRAERGALFVMDRVRMLVRDIDSAAGSERFGTIERIEPEGLFAKIRFDDGAELTVPAILFPAVRLGYAIPAEELKETVSPKRLFAMLDEKVARSLAILTPERPDDGFRFLVAEAGRALSTRLEHELELHRPDAHARREEREVGRSQRPSPSHER